MKASTLVGREPSAQSWCLFPFQFLFHRNAPNWHLKYFKSLFEILLASNLQRSWSLPNSSLDLLSPPSIKQPTISTNTMPVVSLWSSPSEWPTFCLYTCFTKASNLLSCSDKKVLPGQQWKKTVPPSTRVLSLVPNLNLGIPYLGIFVFKFIHPDCVSLLLGFHTFESEKGLVN